MATTAGTGGGEVLRSERIAGGILPKVPVKARSTSGQTRPLAPFWAFSPVFAPGGPVSW